MMTEGIISPETVDVAWAPRVAHWVGIDDLGRALISVNADGTSPCSARSIIDISLCGREVVDIPVLVVFENGDLSLPIIVGRIRDPLPISAPTDVVLTLPRPEEAAVDRQRVVLDAKQEIVLRCGKSSITLRKDGSVVIRGTRLLSRASETNKIKGGSVAIN